MPVEADLKVGLYKIGVEGRTKLVRERRECQRIWCYNPQP